MTEAEIAATRREQKMDHDDEIKRGRKVRGYASKGMFEKFPSGGGWTISGEPGGSCTEKVLMVFPPEPLEITGYHSDIEHCTCVPNARCATTSQDKLECQPVTLVKKGACQCESQ